MNIDRTTTLGKLIDRCLNKKKTADKVTNGDDIIEFIQNTSHVLCEINSAGYWAFLSTNWHDLTGYTPEESIKSHHFNFIHPDDLNDYKTFFYSIDLQENPYDSHVLRLICNNGQVRWARITVKAITGDHEASSSHMIALISDIDEQTTQMHRLNVRLQSLEKLIEYVPGMIYRGLNNTKWTMEFVSAGCYEITGYQPEDLIKNKTLSFASLIHPDDQQYVWNEVQCAVDEYRTFDLTYRIITADNDIKWIWEQGQGVFSSSGELLVLEGYIADITQDREADEARKSSLLYDENTGYPNWQLFNDRLNEAINRRQSDSRYAFVFILLQLDKSEDIENIYGKDVFNLLMVELQKKITKSFEYAGSVSRANDETLGILLESIDGFNNLNKVIQNIHEVVLLPVQVYEYEIYASASLGVTLSTKIYSSSNELIYDAEQALSRARALGGARHEVFDLKQHAKAAAQSKHENEVREALENGGMQVWWQPVVCLKTNIPAGLEAKLVWNHSRRGTLFAEDFVPQLTNTQLLMQLWQFMLSNACQHMSEWKSIPEFNELGVNIQIFGETLLAADSILRLSESLIESKPSSCSISLGVPEDVFLRATDTVHEMLDWLQSRDISIILDSFGEGVCSLATLKRYPLDMIRLHPLLLDKQHCDPRFVKSVVSLVHSFDIPVIADRLSSKSQLGIAHDYNIDYVQGPIVAEAMPFSQIPQNIADHQLKSSSI